MNTLKRISLKLGNWLQRLDDRMERARQRRALVKLDERALHDLGLGRSEILREFGKPFWKA